VHVVQTPGGAREAPNWRGPLKIVPLSGRVGILPISGPFNFSALITPASNRRAAKNVVLLNNDVHAIDAGLAA
jgi:hypothetical protein